MFNWMKKILGFAAKDEQPVGPPFASVPGSPATVAAMNAGPVRPERLPVSDAELGAFLLQRLAQDPSLSELSLAAMVGRNVSHVRKLLGAAQERQGNAD